MRGRKLSKSLIRLCTKEWKCLQFINLVNVSKSYEIDKDQVYILKDINLKINEGEFVAIIGPSGSGKTTLMNIIGLLDVPSGGEYFLSSHQVSKLEEEDLAYLRNHYLGFVFQNFQLLPRANSIKNVELPLIYAGVPRRKRLTSAKKSLQLVELKGKEKHLPSQLSGGQKQRVAIARALINNPSIILADEPTGALDTKTSKLIMNQLEKINKSGTTVIIVTHDLEVASYADRIIEVKDGEIKKG